MKTFIAKSTVYVSHYMCNDEDEREETDIVQAESEADAKALVELFYESRTSEYSVYYSCVVETIKEMITSELLNAES